MLLLLLLLREQITTFVRVYHLQYGAILGAIGPVEAWMCQAYCVKVSSKSDSPFVFTDREKGMLLLLLLSVLCSTRGPV